MFTVFASAVLVANLLSPSLAQTDSLERFRNTQEERIEARREALDEFRENRQEAVEKLIQSREEFRERVSEIRDERKQKILLNLDERFEHVNEKWTDHWNNVLSRLTAILEKIEERDETLDTSEAAAAISRAQEAVNTQAGKTYQIEITDEENLREEVQSLVSQFKEDMRTTKSAVDEARQEVVLLFRSINDEE